ncbi:type II toxin-antitoxin system VapC family toxin [Rhodoferax antarcticus]|uniref:PIN domain protein n=1 Tax=Rhodoferax antarcticus ANT.BR TaxID=1111071 RepID=A0A1Q8YE22_9BURK|nr:type II toxin-antitoxin system VapC family toxin [Rhodoferax antarcticus]APW46055.1 VapC toxin family PIN domain ribonuclease [Rhodoferax antarcticus]MCW2310376.1 putative nucleic acid-binding protein [Rhodoferax antarcticus]OLP06202.1 PIN domain protein [Rhodoferax antarcticus ANT.BR]
MYLLDTHVISELRKAKPHVGVLAWLQGTAESDLYISAVTLGEIQRGIELTREQNAPKALEISQWAGRLSNVHNILPVDVAIFRLWAKLLHRRSDALFEDAMIAATALTHHLIVVTRNTQDFAGFNVPLLNPFNSYD